MEPSQNLPEGVLKAIFKNLSSRDLLECRLVCSNWYPLTTKIMFRNLKIRHNDHLKAFLSFKTRRTPPGLIPLGVFVRKISLFHQSMPRQRSSRLTHQALLKLMTYCPNVEILDAADWVFQNSLGELLLYLRGSNHWKLQKIECNNPWVITARIYYTFNNTITHIDGPSDVRDLRYIEHFPALKNLKTPESILLRTVQEFTYICATCPQLTYLSVHTAMDDVPVSDKNSELISYLEGLTIASHNSVIPKALVKYLILRCVNLSKIIIYLVPEMLHPRIDIYLSQLAMFLISGSRRQKTNLCLNLISKKTDAIERDYTTTDEIITKCFKCIFEVPPEMSSAYNVMTISEYCTFQDESDILLNTTWKRRRDGTLISNSELTLEAAYSNSRMASYFEMIPTNIHKLSIECTAESGNIPGYVWRYLMACQELEDLYICPDVVSHCPGGVIMHSLRRLHIQSCIVNSKLFGELHTICPNLQELHVSDIETDNNILHMEKMNLIGFSFDTRPRSLRDDGQEWLVTVKTSRGICYFKTQGIQPPVQLSKEEAVTLYLNLGNYSVYYLQVNDVATFTLNEFITELNPFLPQNMLDVRLYT